MDDRLPGGTTVHLLCGLVGAGKTTVAKRVASQTGATRFTLDQWMLRLFDLTPYDAEYGDRAERVKQLIWDVAGELLRHGHDVVLDWSHWSREQRRDAHDRALAMDASVVVHYVDVTIEEATARLRRRNAALPAGAHHIDIDEMRRFSLEFFNPPTPDEGLETILETSS